MENNITSEKFASVIARILDDNKAQDIVILNVSNVCSLSDYFIIATGNSTPQVRGLTETIRKKVKDIFKRLPIGLETEKQNSWNLLDYGEVVVHIMHTTQRETYKIEKFWSHALTLDRETWEENSKEYSIYE
ncbi:MAG: ribosome silencing factor [Candidatus Gastranaerophilales bacterium]|nr:ribosome silencing factor [Candidatus Gastranaerophilales bacterium]